MRTISKGRLKAKMLACFREVEATGEPLIVTDHGREVLEVRPIQKQAEGSAAVLAAYRSGARSTVKIPDEETLLRSDAESDWSILGDSEKW